MRKVIFITDGDLAAKKVLECLAVELNCRVIGASYGNPTTINAEVLASFVLAAPDVPILVMFDDCGIRDYGPGENAMRYLASHPEIEVIGAVAVASQTHAKEWTHVDVSIDRFGHRTAYGVDKEGLPDLEIGRINGDTVSVLDQLNLPCVVGIGDIGKMARFDDVKRGAPVTRKALEYILERSGYLERSFENDDI
ncbi:stage V sporulation protein AE [Bacillus sp. JCM 19041]|uniref:stage V sporulation protein AE n=1 Tax=Bacillus sp. JCM 19041 TaxID=1460637 RepID=UPI0006D28524